VIFILSTGCNDLTPSFRKDPRQYQNCIL